MRIRIANHPQTRPADGVQKAKKPSTLRQPSRDPNVQGAPALLQGSAISREIRADGVARELRQVGRWNAPPGDLPAKDQERETRRRGPDPNVLDHQVTMHHRPWRATAQFFQFAPVRLQDIALRRDGPKNRQVFLWER